jgi:hypothetical protein
MFKGFVEGLRALIGGSGDTYEERRRLIRLKSRYPVICQSADKQFKAVVVDMGLEGMKLHGVINLKRGADVTVSLQQKDGSGNDAIRCKVVWCRHYKVNDKLVAGVKYEDTKENMSRSWVKKVLRELGFTEKSIYQKRKQMRIPASMVLEVYTKRDEFLANGTLRNLGVGGALCELETEMPRGKELILKIGPFEKMPVLEIKGQVVGVDKNVSRQTFFHRVQFCEDRPGSIKTLGKYLIALLRTAGDI